MAGGANAGTNASGAGGLYPIEAWGLTGPRARSAMACLPFENPKLAVVAQGTKNDIAVLLDRMIKRYEEMKLIEANKVIEARPTNGGNGEKVDARLPSRTSDRRYRRL